MTRITFAVLLTLLGFVMGAIFMALDGAPPLAALPLDLLLLSGMTACFYAASNLLTRQQN